MIKTGSDFSGVKWNDIPEFEGYYKVSNTGIVKSLQRPVDNPVNKTTKERILKTSIKRGYKCVVLQKDGKRKHISVHRLVAISFLPNPENKPQVNHINGIKTDNRVENLEWATSKENIKHAFDRKLRSSQTGSENNKAKLSDADIKNIRKLKKEGATDVLLAKIYQVNRNTISDIKNKRTWAHL